MATYGNDTMNPWLIYRCIALVIAGILCLPATYDLSRTGHLWLSAVIVAGVAALGVSVFLLLKGSEHQFKYLFCGLSYATGALVAETAFFTHYYLTYGHQDPNLAVGIAVVVIEFITITVIGLVVIYLILFFLDRSRQCPRTGQSSV